VSERAFVLHGYWRSSASWRVRIALAWKGLAYAQRPVHLVKDGGEHRKDAYRALNPMGEVPLLVVAGGAPDGGELRLTQSVAICEYLEEQYPAPALLPAHPADRARVRALVEVVNSGIHPVQNLKVLQRIEADFGAAQEGRVAWARGWIARGFEGLEGHLAATAGRHAFGDAVTLADVFIVPQVYNAHRFGVDMAPFPTIARIAHAAAALPAFAAAHPDRQPDAPPPA
jgi:maleylpyruvate isomerase